MNPQMLQKMTPMMLQQLKMNNPKMANQIQEMMRNGTNPYNLFKQTVGGYDEKTKTNFINQAKQFGFNEDFLNQVMKGGEL